jgi:hypothetical protein
MKKYEITPGFSGDGAERLVWDGQGDQGWTQVESKQVEDRTCLDAKNGTWQVLAKSLRITQEGKRVGRYPSMLKSASTHQVLQKLDLVIVLLCKQVFARSVPAPSG